MPKALVICYVIGSIDAFSVDITDADADARTVHQTNQQRHCRRQRYQRRNLLRQAASAASMLLKMCYTEEFFLDWGVLSFERGGYKHHVNELKTHSADIADAWYLAGGRWGPIRLVDSCTG